jgi:gliding motility-associated-like protein
LTVYLDASGNATITATDIDNGSADNCSSITLAIDSANFDCSNVGANPVKLYVTDANSNIDSTSVVLTVLDTLNPIVVAQNITVYLDALGAATITTADIDNGSADNCSSITLTLDSSSFDCGETGANTVKLYAIDANSNIDSATSIVTVMDTLIPSISGCPVNISVSTDANRCDAVVTWTAPTALDNCIVDSLVSNFTPGSTFPLGVTTITYISYDLSMNTDTCSFTITVTDNEDPVISGAPAPIAVNNDAGNCSAIVNWTLPTAADNCTLDSLVGNYTPGDVFPVGTTTVTYIAYDPEMNTDTINFDITVSDNEAPVITCQADTSTCDQIVNYTVPTAVDNCPAVTVTQIAGLASGSTFPFGATINTYVAEDAIGNKDTCSFTVTVFETPSIAIAGVDTNICESTYPLTADAITVGSGLWTSPDATVSFVDNTAPVTTVSNLKRGDNLLIWTVTNGVCDPQIDTVIVTYDSDPTIANAGSDIVLCELNLATFDANTPVIGNGVWSILSGNGQFTNVNDPTSNVEVSDNTFNSFIWTISNGTCVASSDTINVKAASNPTANAGDSIFIYKDDGVQLNVESDSTNLSYVWTPSFSIEGSNTVQSPYARPSETTEYTVVVTTDDGCFTTDRILVTVSDLLKIPTAFTPDGDGVNDTWDIKNTEEFASVDVIIYNANGNEVFSSSNYLPWDGKYEGKDLGIGSYYYVVKITDQNGKNSVKTGIVSILR